MSIFSRKEGEDPFLGGLRHPSSLDLVTALRDLLFFSVHSVNRLLIYYVLQTDKAEKQPLSLRPAQPRRTREPVAQYLGPLILKNQCQVVRGFLFVLAK